RRDRAAADRACRDAGGRAPPALAADRPDAARAAAPGAGGCGMTRRSKLGQLSAAVAVLGGLVAGCSSSPPPELERRAVPQLVASDPAKPCTKGASGEPAPSPSEGSSSSGSVG